MILYIKHCVVTSNVEIPYLKIYILETMLFILVETSFESSLVREQGN